MSRPLARRTVLRAAGGLALALPLLSTRRAEAQSGQVYPTRFICLCQPNGTLPSKWWPTPGMSESDFTLNTIHAPLERHKESLLILRGIDLEVSIKEGLGEPHQKGMGAMLTGTALLEGDFVGGDGSRAGWASGKSIDQHLAQRIGANTKIGSLLLGVRCDRSEVRQRLSYLGSGAPVPPENDPRKVFDTLFSDMVETVSPELQAIRRRRASVLDGVGEQLELASRRAGVEDRRKLEAHLTQLRDLERRLTANVMTGVGCGKPAQPDGVDLTADLSIPTISRQQIDLLVTAMACDLTRVGVMQYSCALNTVTMPWLGSHNEGHYLSHLGDSDERKPQLETRDQWVAGELAYLMDRLASVPEGEGTMLDHTVIFWCNELAVGNTHSQVDMPYVLAGRGGGLRPGRYLQFPRRSHNDVLVSLLNLMGVEETTWGNPNYCAGPLSGLT